MLIIAQRINTILNADQIVVLNEGNCRNRNPQGADGRLQRVPGNCKITDERRGGIMDQEKRETGEELELEFQTMP